jgi:hypothetical protein
MTIVTSTHRCKRPPPRKPKAVALDGPAVLKIDLEWRSDGDDPLPSTAEALALPLKAFPG